MTAPTTADMNSAAAELRAAIHEHEIVCKLLGGDPNNPNDYGAEGRYKKARQEAHARSTLEHPKRRVAEHETVADAEAFDEWAYFNALSYQLKSLKEKMHSLRQVLSAYQTQARSEADATRTGP